MKISQNEADVGTKMAAVSRGLLGYTVPCRQWTGGVGYVGTQQSLGVIRDHGGLLSGPEILLGLQALAPFREGRPVGLSSRRLG